MRGVKTYALEILESLEKTQDLTNLQLLKKAALNGAADWQRYLEGGCALIYNGDIAKRLCNPTELKKTSGGRNFPNAREDWINVQARALFQAWNLICNGAEF